MIREFINIVEGMRVTDDWFKDGAVTLIRLVQRNALKRIQMDRKVTSMFLLINYTQTGNEKT